jgi:ATP-dependent Clp protease ATP-binding subunit ClpA
MENSRGQVANFKGCDIIMTSNIAQAKIADFQKKGITGKPFEEMIDEEMKKVFPNEIVGRINKKIIYKALSPEAARDVIDLQVKQLSKSIKLRDDFELDVTPEMRQKIFDSGYSTDTGARNLEDALQTYVHEPLVEIIEDKILAGEPLAKRTATVTWEENKPKISFSPVLQQTEAVVDAPKPPEPPKSPVTADQVKFTEDVGIILKNMLRIPVPAPAAKSWPLTLMSLLCGDNSVTKYLEDYCQINRFAISHAINKRGLPSLAHLKEEKLDNKFYANDLKPQIKAFAASEGKELVTPVLLWRWLMKSDPTGTLEMLLKKCDLEPNKLREAPEPRPPAGPPVKPTQNEITGFRNAMKAVPEKIKGQDEPITQLINGMRVARHGYTMNPNKPNRPKVRFLLLGPSGVGKTYSAELLAQQLGRPIIKIAFSELMDEMDAKRFTGAAPGYVGHEDPNFVDKIREANANSLKYGTPPPLIILDEIEKGHRLTHQTIMQILDKGEMENSRGQKASFRDCDIIMTANIAQTTIAEAQNRGVQGKELEELVDNELKKAFPREVVGRINKKIIFNVLSKKAAREILDLQLDEYNQTLQTQKGFSLEVAPAMRQQIVRKGYDTDTGYRSIEAAMQHDVHEPVLEAYENEVVAETPVLNGKMFITWKDSKPSIKFTPAPPAPPPPP